MKSSNVTIQKLLHEQYFPLALFMMTVVKMKIMAVFTLETGYPLVKRGSDRQYVLMRKWNGLNFGWIIRLNLSICFPSILTDFEDGLSVSDV